jgi:uncharacterized membrane protein YoaK (UPF0700 family)
LEQIWAKSDPFLRQQHIIGMITRMLVHEGATRSPTVDIVLATCLAFVAGGVNSAGFVAFGYFSANMTGNVSMISDHISLSTPVIALAFATIVAMFIIGATVAALLIEMGKRRHLMNIYAATLLCEAALLIAVGLYHFGAGRTANGLLTAGILSLTMGIQNAASTRISDGRVRTTHVSGVATDLGVGIALLIHRRRPTDTPQILERLKLHTATILSFLLGGIAGVSGFRFTGGLVFCCLGLLLLGICGRSVLRRQ